MSNSAMSPQANRTHQGLTPGNVIWGFAGAIMGAIAGYAAGDTIGGIWMTRFSIGSLDGAEATGVLSAVVCGIAVGVLSYWLALRHQATAVVWGFAGVIIGMLTGFYLVPTFGSLLGVPGFSIGNQVGEEAAAMVGGILGGIAAGGGLFWFALRRRSRQSAAR